MSSKNLVLFSEVQDCTSLDRWVKVSPASTKLWRSFKLLALFFTVRRDAELVGTSWDCLIGAKLSGYEKPGMIDDCTILKLLKMHTYLPWSTFFLGLCSSERLTRGTCNADSTRDSGLVTGCLIISYNTQSTGTYLHELCKWGNSGTLLLHRLLASLIFLIVSCIMCSNCSSIFQVIPITIGTQKLMRLLLSDIQSSNTTVHSLYGFPLSSAFMHFGGVCCYWIGFTSLPK